MSTQNLDDAEYPYASRPPMVLVKADFSRPITRSWSGRMFLIWMLRAMLVVGVMGAILTVPMGIVGYRAGRQAGFVADLEARGCRVEYSLVPSDDQMQRWLQEVFGRNYFGEVDGVSATGLSNPDDPRAICNICRHLHGLRSFEIASDSFSFREMANWKHLDELVALNLQSTTISDEDLARIGRMPKLRTLRVSSLRITDAGLSHLAGLSQLGILTIESAQLNGTGSPNSKGFPDLGTLEILNSPRVSDAVVVNLGPLPALLSFNVSETQIGDAAVAHAAKGGMLTNANLSQTRITDAALESLAKCADLFSLFIDGTQVTDEGITFLANCTGLSYLDLAGTKVTGKGFGVLRGNDLTLTLDRTAITEEGMRDVLKIPGLARVSLQDTKLTGAAGRVLVESGLTLGIDLSGAMLIDEGLETLARAKIPDLNLTRTGFDDKALMSFASNDDVTSLNVSETKVTAEGVRAFYETRKQRLAAAGRQETMYVVSDFPDISEQYLPDVMGPGGMMLLGEPEQPVEAGQAEPGAPVPDAPQ